MTQSSPKIISLVPSWTEMLIEANIPLAGRTRFCIEPHDTVNSIPIVGGTKDWDLDKIRAIQPDLLILDKDENPKMMAEAGLHYLATHVEDIASCHEGIRQIKTELSLLGLTLSAENLTPIAQRWMSQESNHAKWKLNTTSWDTLPGLIEWVQKPKQPIKEIHYIIWKNPWMIATKKTFIGTLAEKVGLPLSIHTDKSKYPEFNIETEIKNKESTLLLFSSEPYPFHKKKADLKNLNTPSAIINGQNFTWFGTRSLKFLESQTTPS